MGLQVWGPQFEVPQFEVPQIEVPEFGHAQVEGGHEGGEVQLAGRSALSGRGPMVNYAGSNCGDFNQCC